MTQEKNEFLDESGLQSVINKFVALFARITHTHELSEISDYTVDSSLSSTSTNPIQNNVVTIAIDNVLDEAKGYTDGKNFIGTYAEYKTAYARGNIAIGTLVIITDDETSSSGSGSDEDNSSTSTSSLLGSGVLGYMILG